MGSCSIEVRQVFSRGSLNDVLVSRIVFGRSETHEADLTVDINTDIYPLEPGTRMGVVLATTLNLDGTPDSQYFDPTQQKNTLADEYEYVMHGRVYKYTLDEKAAVPRVAVLVSFGGLLMELKSDPRSLLGVELDSKVYLLMRRA